MTIEGERKYSNSQNLQNENIQNEDNIKNENESETKQVENQVDKQEEAQNNRFHKRERFYGKFSQSVVLPENIEQDLSKAAAKFEDGVSSISIPKMETKVSEQHQVEIL